MLAASHLLSVLDGLLVLSDKGTSAVRLLHPLTGALAEFPVIANVRDRGGARVAMDVFRSRFPGLGPEPPNGYDIDYPAFNTVFTSAGVDESTSPPTLQLPVRDEAWLVLLAKPGDAHWEPLYPPHELMNNELVMFSYTYICARGSPFCTSTTKRKESIFVPGQDCEESCVCLI